MPQSQAVGGTKGHQGHQGHQGEADSGAAGVAAPRANSKFSTGEDPFADAAGLDTHGVGDR